MPERDAMNERETVTRWLCPENGRTVDDYYCDDCLLTGECSRTLVVFTHISPGEVVVKVARLKAYEDAEGLLLTMLEAMRSGAVDVTSEPVSDGQREWPWHEEWVSYATKYEDEYGPGAGPEVKG